MVVEEEVVVGGTTEVVVEGGTVGKREVNPFDNDDAETEPSFTEQDITVINFDAYGDIYSD